jgi:laccase
VDHLLEVARRTGGEVSISDANTINGQPGDLFPCSQKGTFKAPVESGKTYLLRIINAGLANDLFFGVAGHHLTVVGTDARYTKPFTIDHIFISPGQTVDALLEANHTNGSYYMAARTFASNTDIRFNNSTATAILEYSNARARTPDIPNLPAIDDLNTSLAYTAQLRSLGSEEHPVDVPTHVDEHMLITLAVNMVSCETGSGTCEEPERYRIAASLNNISFHLPSADILDAYYGSVRGVYEADFPDKPPFVFNFTDDVSNLPTERWFTKRGTKVKVLEYGDVVEVVFQGTAILGTENHPMHLHGFAFYVVGRGFGNFNETTDPATYNLIDPPFQNTITVPKAGWAAIRFRAANPGE